MLRGLDITDLEYYTLLPCVNSNADGIRGRGLAADEVLRHEGCTEKVGSDDGCEVVPGNLAHGGGNAIGAGVVDQGLGGAAEGLLDLGVEVLDFGFDGDVDGDADNFRESVGGDGFGLFLDFGELVWFAACEDYRGAGAGPD